MSPFTKIPLLLLTLLFPIYSQARIISKANYNYPIVDPDEATVASSALHVDSTQNIEMKIKVRDRQIRDYYRERELHVRYYPSATPTNHILFIISGIGGDGDTGYSAFLAASAQVRGVDAVILPNAITPNFIISSSTTGLVGGSAQDASDMYDGIVGIKKQLAAQGHTYSKNSLLGYSHGALVAAFIQASDQKALAVRSSDAVHFDTTLLINPPVDLLHAIRTIDARTKATSEIGLKTLIKLALRFRKLVSRFSQILTTPESHVEFSQQLKMDAKERYALIGRALSLNLPASILASQAIDDLGILPELDDDPSSVAYRYSRSDRSSAASSYNYEGYVTTFFNAHAVKTKSPAFSLEQLNDMNSLTALTDMLHTSKTVFLMDNMDDLLLTNGQAYWLDQLFDGRAIIYPTGGHLGNLWYPDNMLAFSQWLYYGRF